MNAGQRIFFGPFGLRAGWRFLLFAIVFALLAMPFSAGAAWLRRAVPNDAFIFLREALTLIPVLLATWLLARLDRQPFYAYGLQPRNSMRNLAAGAASGFLALSILIALLFAAGAAEMQTRDLRGAVPIAAWGGYWLVFFIMVGFSEEMLTRGYPLFAVSQGIGFWPAAALFSLVFGLGHLGNSGEDYAGIANAVLAGLVFAFSLKWTGSLWWAIGAHMAWDWAQTFFFGVADSGVAARHHLLSVAPAGATWLSGGRTGPEGSVLCIPVLLLLGAAARFTAPPLESPGLERRRAPAGGPDETPEPTSLPSISPSTYSADSGDTN